jgi:(2Fe-2S) ferredoxin
MTGNSGSTAQPPRIVVCLGVNCNLGERAEKLYARLEAILDDPATDILNPPFKLRTANCLDRCEHGPNLVIHPGGIHCHHLDEETLTRVLEVHIANGVKSSDGPGKS